jgi:hypothetical protein
MRIAGSYHRVPGITGMITPEYSLEFQILLPYRNNMQNVLFLKK